MQATTCWEDYSGLADPTHPPTPTHNHIFLCGGAGEWLYRSVLGVEPAAPGWKKVAVRPLIIAGGPASASGHVLTVRGKVSVQWRRAPAPDHVRSPAPREAHISVTPNSWCNVSGQKC